jgi:hypothetical protein
MFPTPRADHEIVYVNEADKVAYSVGRDRRFRKATWTSITDMVSTWGAVKSTSPDNVVWAAAGVFFKEAVTGHLFMYESNQSNGVDNLLRSTDAGATWASVLTMPGAEHQAAPRPAVRGAGPGHELPLPSGVHHRSRLHYRGYLAFDG